MFSEKNINIKHLKHDQMYRIALKHHWFILNVLQLTKFFRQKGTQASCKDGNYFLIKIAEIKFWILHYIKWQKYFINFSKTTLKPFHEKLLAVGLRNVTCKSNQATEVRSYLKISKCISKMRRRNVFVIHSYLYSKNFIF